VAANIGEAMGIDRARARFEQWRKDPLKLDATRREIDVVLEE
jgi:hypothetical protein